MIVFFCVHGLRACYWRLNKLHVYHCFNYSDIAEENWGVASIWWVSAPYSPIAGAAAATGIDDIFVHIAGKCTEIAMTRPHEGHATFTLKDSHVRQV